MFFHPVQAIEKWAQRQRGTGLLSAEWLVFPLSEATRRERRSLLGLSLLSVFIVWTGLVPSRIDALGLTFEETDQVWLVRLLGVVLLYFWVIFLVYGTTDFIAWRVKYWADVTESAGTDPSLEGRSAAYQDAVKKRYNLLIVFQGNSSAAVDD